MASTNKTPNYNLPQFISTDKPSWLGDFNSAMLAIDTAIKGAADEGTSAASQANTASEAANAASEAAKAAQDAAEAATSQVGSISTIANQAQSTATAANTKANQAYTLAETAKTAAVTAQSTASAAASAASNAQSTANGAASNAQQAIDKIPKIITGSSGNNKRAVIMLTPDNHGFAFFDISGTINFSSSSPILSVDVGVNLSLNVNVSAAITAASDSSVVAMGFYLKSNGTTLELTATNTGSEQISSTSILIPF